jgi:hypothetical protein
MPSLDGMEFTRQTPCEMKLDAPLSKCTTNNGNVVHIGPTELKQGVVPALTRQEM